MDPTAHGQAATRSRASALHDPALQELAEYAAEVLGAPVGLVTELGEERQTFLANVGFARDWTTIEESLCAHAVLQEGVFEVPDAAADPRFRDNPLVTGEPRVRFYAGVAVRVGEGKPTNALCVLDTRPRELTDFQRRTLEMLARQVEARLELRRRESESEAALVDSRRNAGLLRMVTDRLPVRVAYFDRDYRFRFVNDAYLTQVGLSREDALGRTIAEALGEPLFAQARPNIDRALAGETHTQEFDALYETGARSIRATYVPDLDAQGRPSGVVVQVVDLTEQRAAEAEKRSMETRYGAVFDALDEGFCLLETIPDASGRTVDYRFKAFNPAFELQAGVPAEKARAGLTIRQIAPDIEEGWIEAYGRIAATGVPERFEMGSEVLGRYCEVYAFRLGGKGSREVAVLFKDVSERRAAERSLSEARGRLDAVLGAAEVGVWDYDPATGAIGADANLAAMFGLDAQEAAHAPAETFIERIHADDQPKIAEAFARAVAEGTPYDVGYRTVVGTQVRHLVARGFAERDDEGRVVRMPGAVLDVTAIAAAQERERVSAETLRVVFEQAPDDAILVMDENRVLTAWNPAAERITGWSAEEAIGQLADLIFTPEDRREGAPAQETGGAARRGKARDERWHMKRDGSRFWGSGTMNALHDAEGNVVGFLKVFRDATERYEEAERERRQAEELERKVEERTSELAQAVTEAEGFNYSIAHDLRTPLRAMVMVSGVLIEDLGPELGEEHRELLERQAHNANRLGRLIDELLRLSRFARVEVKRQPLDLTGKARRVFAEMEDQGRTNGCRLDVQEGMAASGDPELMRTVLHNLLGNACKFSPGGGRGRMRQEGNVFSVADEGVGFDMAHAKRMFLPFERLVRDEEFEGTGIGLANVKRIVERHGGRAWAESEPGRGATFFFTLGPG